MLAMMRKPALNRFQGIGAYANEAPLPLDAPLDQPGVLQHLQVPGDRLGTDGESGRDLTDAELACRQQSFDDGAPRGIGERGKEIVQLQATCERHGRHPYSTHLLINTLV